MLGEDPAVTGRAAIAKQGMREDSQITQALGGRVSSTEGTSADCFSPVLTSSPGQGLSSVLSSSQDTSKFLLTLSAPPPSVVSCILSQGSYSR